MKYFLNIIRSVWVWFAAIIFMGFFSLYLIVAQSQPKDSTELVISVPESDFSVIARGNVDIEGGVIKVSARVGGVFEKVLVGQGDRVVKGQVLAIQDAAGEELEIRNANIRVETAKLNLEESMLNRKITEREYDRIKMQRELDALPEADLDRASDTLDRAEIAIRRNEGKLENAEAELASVSYTLEQRKIRAPVDGKVLEVYAKPGVGASLNQVSTAFLLLPDGDKIIKVQIREEDIKNVQVGQKVIITPRSEPENEFEGEVVRIANIFTGYDSPQPGLNINTIEVVILSADLPLKIGRPVFVKFRKFN